MSATVTIGAISTSEEGVYRLHVSGAMCKRHNILRQRRTARSEFLLGSAWQDAQDFIHHVTCAEIVEHGPSIWRTEELLGGWRSYVSLFTIRKGCQTGGQRSCFGL